MKPKRISGKDITSYESKYFALMIMVHPHNKA